MPNLLRLSIVPLISPFVWQGPLIPVLPERLYEYLQAPGTFTRDSIGDQEEIALEIILEINVNQHCSGLIRPLQC
jgi:hypothetical protein